MMSRCHLTTIYADSSRPNTPKHAKKIACGGHFRKISGQPRLCMPIGTSDEILSFIEGSGVIRVAGVVDLKKWLRFREKLDACWFLTSKRLLETGRKV
jgi:hypothetical protein